MKETKLYRYKKSVTKVANTSSSTEIKNTGPDHARIVMSNIFRTAERYVNIFAGNLNGDISSGDYIVELEKFLKRGGILKVILQYPPSKKSQAVPLILKYRLKYPERIYLGIARSLDTVLETDGIHHFTTADNRMYRDEYPEKDTWRYVAKVNFNDPKHVAYLNKKFNNVPSMSYEP